MEANGYRIIKSICEKSETQTNLTLIYYCEQILDIIEKNYIRGRVIISTELGENTFQITERRNRKITKVVLNKMESLRHYKHRPSFIERTLIYLYDYTLIYWMDKNDLIDLIVFLVKKYSKTIGIQCIAYACLYNLTRNPIGSKVDKAILAKLFELPLAVMGLFPNHHRLQMNALMLICEQNILQSVKFDRNILIESVIALMEKFPKLVDLQTNALHCLYCLTKDILDEIEPKIFENVVSATLRAMETFPNNYHLEKNGLLVLFDSSSVRDALFDKLKFLQLLLDAIDNFKDSHLNRIAMKICSKITNNFSNTEKSNFSSNSLNMERLLNIIRNHVQSSKNYDRITEFTLETIYNITNEEIVKADTKILEDISEITLKVMELFPKKQKLQKYSLLILNSNVNLQSITYDMNKYIHLAMASLKNFKDTQMNVCAIHICSTLAGRISATEKSDLFSKPIYMEILLNIVIKSIRLKSENHEIFEQTLTTLSILTESSKICEIFSNKGGIDLCFSVLNVTILLRFPKYFYLELILLF
jgi:hypothetical protein